MGNSDRARQTQFELMVSYMEQHGDIQYLSKLESDKRWIELTDLLNDKSVGEPKPIEKWRKCWSDFKNNTKKKEMKIKRQDCRAGLSDLEKRLLKVVVNKKKFNGLENESTIVFQPETVPEETTFKMSPSSVSPTENYLQDIEYELIDHQQSSSTPSMTSETCNDEAPPEKKKKWFLENDKDMAEKYLDFEREKEQFAHERKMAKVRQNDQLITIFGKVVNVLEQLTPSIQKILNQ